MYRGDRKLRVRGALIAAPLACALMLSPAPAFAQVTGDDQQAQAPAQDPQTQAPVQVEREDDAVTMRVQHPTPPPTGIVETGAWTVTPMLGFGFGGNLENSPMALGVAAAYNWTPRVSFEGELGYARSARQGVIDPFTSGVTTGNVNALYHFSANNWAPYATVGLGFGHATNTPFGVDASNTALMLNFGGGLQTSLGENVNLRTGVRYYNGNDFVPSFWRPYVGLNFIVGRTR
jgi:opacity protein-like surface antigen